MKPKPQPTSLINPYAKLPPTKPTSLSPTAGVEQYSTKYLQTLGIVKRQGRVGHTAFERRIKRCIGRGRKVVRRERLKSGVLTTAIESRKRVKFAEDEKEKDGWSDYDEDDEDEDENYGSGDSDGPRRKNSDERTITSNSSIASWKRFKVDSDIEEFKGEDSVYMEPDELMKKIEDMKKTVSKFPKLEGVIPATIEEMEELTKVEVPNISNKAALPKQNSFKLKSITKPIQRPSAIPSAKSTTSKLSTPAPVRPLSPKSLEIQNKVNSFKSKINQMKNKL